MLVDTPDVDVQPGLARVSDASRGHSATCPIAAVVDRQPAEPPTRLDGTDVGTGPVVVDKSNINDITQYISEGIR